MTSDLDATTLAAMRAAAPAVHNGTYTVSHPERGHFTIKLYTGTKGQWLGRRILSMLIGPNNELNYQGVAFWNDARKVATVWSRFRGPESRMAIDGYQWQGVGWSAIEQKLAIWCDLATRGTAEDRHGHWYTHGYRLLVESRCCVCNKKLTHPESITSGIGPECAKRK
jgi:hypothetical protein